MQIKITAPSDNDREITGNVNGFNFTIPIDGKFHDLPEDDERREGVLSVLNDSSVGFELQDDEARESAAASGGAGGEGLTPAPLTPSDMLLGSGVLPSMVPIGDTEVQLGEVVRGAFEASELSVEEWNALEGDAREQLLQDEVDRLISEATGQGSGDEETVVVGASQEEEPTNPLPSLDKAVEKITPDLPGLTVAQLNELRSAEDTGKTRTTLIAAIDAEIETRG